VARHAIDFWLTSEDLPRPDNRVLVDREGRIHPHYTDANTEGHKRLVAKLKALLPALGCHPTLIPNQGSATSGSPWRAWRISAERFASETTPATSVLDVDCKAHDVDNVYVVDTSVFPSSSAVNPALTAMANALRVGDHLIERLGATRASRPAEEAMVS
jgi:hypothetical protein